MPICRRRNGVARSRAFAVSARALSSPSDGVAHACLLQVGLSCTRVSVMKPMPGSWTSRTSRCASSLRIWSATRSGREPCDMRMNADQRSSEVQNV